jgi:hypothetical protein
MFLVLTRDPEVKAILHVRCNVAGFRPRGLRQSQGVPYPQESMSQRSKLGPLVCRMTLSGTKLEVVVLMDDVSIGRHEMEIEVDRPRQYQSYSAESWQDMEE